MGGEIAGGLATSRLGGRLDFFLGKIDFRSGGIVPVGRGNCCRRWPATGLSFASASTTSSSSSSPPAREFSFAAGSNLLLARTRSPPLPAANIAAPGGGSCGRLLRLLRRRGNILAHRLAGLPFGGGCLGWRAEAGNCGLQPQSEIVVYGRRGLPRSLRG